jgi:serine/threonine-protein kinase
MEFVDGPSCAELLREHGALPALEAVDILAQSCRGLHYAHRNGVVHRDVKPGNLLVNPEGVVKLADFGIAKAAEQSDITKVGSVVGTAAYLAPEQTRGEPATAASDVYALGVVAYQLLCGRLPYEGPSLTELARLQESGPPESPARLNPDVPQAIADAVLVALRPLPQERYADMATMEHALRAAERGVRPPEADMDVTVPLAGGTDATRMLETDRTDATRPLAPQRRRQLEPIDEAPSRRQPTAAPARRRGAPEPRKRRSPLRYLGLLVVALALGAIALGIYQLESGGERQRVRTDPVDTQIDAREAVDRLDRLIQDNVR